MNEEWMMNQETKEKVQLQFKELLTTENMEHMFYPRDLYHTVYLSKRPPNFSSTRTTRF